MSEGRVLLALALLFAAACGADPLSPVPSESVTPELDAGTLDASDEDGGGPSAPKRTVIERNPFGNVAESENLLWDGDFEWSSPFSDQYGWLKGPPISYAFDGVEVGPVCRSGIKCASLAKGKILIGIGVSSKDSSLLASFWMKPADGSCAGLTAALIGLTSNGDDDVALGPISEVADATGWCKFEGVSDVRVEKTYLYIKNEREDAIVLDDAVLKAVDVATMQARSFGQTIAMGPPTASEAAELAEVRADLRKLRGPHDPPPNAAKRAMTRWARP